MSRIIGIDFGGKRTGIAETDDLQIIASALTTIETKGLLDFVSNYIDQNGVDEIVIGQAIRMGGEVSEIEKDVLKFIEKLQKRYPHVEIHRVNEAFTSKIALDTMIRAGSKKKTRRVKGNLDKISATLILQDFLEYKRNQQSI